MKTSSAKAKGRKLQQQVCKDLLNVVYTTLEPGDVTSRPMGCNGSDVILSPAAIKITDLAIETKNQEALNVTTTFWEHFEKYKANDALKLLISRKNFHEPIVTLRWSDFLPFLRLANNDKQD